MNERIKELMIKSGAFDYYEVNEGVNGDEKPMEKFAELIVKETMQVVANNLPQNTYLDVADAVIEHFGVEE